MSGFYYDIKLAEFNLTQSQLNKIRDYLREKVRGVAAVDSGEFLRSLATRWNSTTSVLRVQSELEYSGFVEGGNRNYMYHKNKIKDALSAMGLKPSNIGYF
jgi:hypothetical protein